MYVEKLKIKKVTKYFFEILYSIALIFFFNYDSYR